MKSGKVILGDLDNDFKGFEQERKTDRNKKTITITEKSQGTETGTRQ